jgi:PEGA domain
VPFVTRAHLSAALLCTCLVGQAAVAQEDDLAPLPAAKPAAKPKPKPRPKAPSAVRPKSPPPLDDDLAPLGGTLVVKLKTEVKGARLFLDDKEVGLLPQVGQPASLGEHQVSVRRPGYATLNRRVTVGLGKTVELILALEPKLAVLNVASDVPGALVLLNGRTVGNTPLIDFEAPPGTTEVLVRREGYQDERQSLLLVAGKDAALNFRLVASASVAATDAPRRNELLPEAGGELPLEAAQTASTPVTQRWYFWVGAVAVVAAVAAGVVVGLNASRPKAQTKTELCGPDSASTCDVFFQGVVPVGVKF